MPFETEFQKRDKALFAFFMLTGARDGAVALLKLKHFNVELGHVFQDGALGHENLATTISSYFPVTPEWKENINKLQNLKGLKSPSNGGF